MNIIFTVPNFFFEFLAPNRFVYIKSPFVAPVSTPIDIYQSILNP